MESSMSTKKITDTRNRIIIRTYLLQSSRGEITSSTNIRRARDLSSERQSKVVANPLTHRTLSLRISNNGRRTQSTTSSSTITTCTIIRTKFKRGREFLPSRLSITLERKMSNRTGSKSTNLLSLDARNRCSLHSITGEAYQ